MIERAFVLVSGRPGGGKTALIERILESNRSRRMAAVRFAPGAPASAQPEIERYRAAGAWATVAIDCPSGGEEEAALAFEESDFRVDPHEGIFMEGPSTLPVPADSRIVVFRPLRDRQTLLVPRRRIEKITALSLARSLFADPELVRRIARDMKREFEPTTVETTRWEITRPYRDLAGADVVVVNVRGAKEDPAAERTVAEFRRMQKDPDVTRDLGPLVAFHIRRARIFVADLGNRRDPELKKLLARVKRLLPPSHPSPGD